MESLVNTDESTLPIVIQTIDIYHSKIRYSQFGKICHFWIKVEKTTETVPHISIQVNLGTIYARLKLQSLLSSMLLDLYL